MRKLNFKELALNHYKTKQLYKTWKRRNKDKKKKPKKRMSLLVYSEQNKIREIQLRRIYERKHNIHYKLSLNLRIRILKALKRNSKKSNTVKLLGCSVKFAKAYLEKMFKKDMTWKNYGLYGWHIDHIRPCASFDLSKLKEQMKCFHYTNLQPLWWYKNLQKGVKNIE